MRILFVTNMYPDSSNESEGIFIKEQIDHYVSRYNVDFEIYVIRGIQSKFNYLKSLFEIRSLISRSKFDLIHIHFALAGLFLLMNPLIKIPTIVTLHGSDILGYKNNWIIPFIGKLIVSKVSKVIILNEAMRQVLSTIENKLIKIPCGIDVEAFCRERNNFLNDCFLIGFPADKNRFVKNYSLFAKIIQKLIEDGIKIEFVEFSCFTRSEVAELLSKIDCLLMTSLSEGSPQIIKEAMACNVPIVSTNVGDVKMLLDNVDNCYIVDSFEVGLFVEIIKKIRLLHPLQRRSNGRDKILQLRLDQSSVVTQINNVYLDVLDCKSV